MTHLSIALNIYRGLISKISQNGIPIDLRTRSAVGTVQDDPSDSWMETLIREILDDTFEVFHSGTLTTPDLIIRDKKTGIIVGLEVKKLIQKTNGSDSRGLTMDYNSCLPCGSTLIKIGSETLVIPCFYLFALLDNKSENIVSLIMIDGDFLNYDVDLHKESKYSNYTEYNHGSYGEGSIRHRKMYPYPNPLNSKIKSFHLRQIIVAKKIDFERINEQNNIYEQIIRTDKFGNNFYYYLKDETTGAEPNNTLQTITGIFDACKERLPKERTAAIFTISPSKPK